MQYQCARYGKREEGQPSRPPARGTRTIGRMRVRLFADYGAEGVGQDVDLIRLSEVW